MLGTSFKEVLKLYNKREVGRRYLLVPDKSESTQLLLLFQLIYILVKRRKEGATLDIKTYKNDIISGAYDNCLYANNI